MRAEDLPLEQLLLDPNNYRLQDEEGYNPTPADRYHLEQVQRSTYQRIKATGIKELHDSIINNGFLPIERIVVTPYTAAGDVPRYLVIEGNRRIAALRLIKQELDGGVDVPVEVAAVLGAIPCLIVDAGENAFFKETLMGVRHVGGIKQWGGYQRAKLIADMRDDHQLEPPIIAGKLGLRTSEVNRRYRAFKALQQMRDNDDFGDYAEPSLYPIFHEAVETPEVRAWLGWNADANAFNDQEALPRFYALITPRAGEDGGAEVGPKITKYSDVRQLRAILPNPEAKRFLLDPERSFLEAMTVANREHLSRQWRNELTEATTSLEGIGAIEVRNFDHEDVDLLERLIAAANQILDVYRAVQRP